LQRLEFQIIYLYIHYSRIANDRPMPYRQSNPQIILKPQDLVVLLRLALDSNGAPTYAALAAELSLAASEIHAGLERAALAQLARKDRAGRPAVVREALKRFVEHGARYSFPAIHGAATRGVPTGYAAPPLKNKIVQSNELPPVWPYNHGSVRGMAFYPLYPAVPEAAARNPNLYESLVLFDAVRGGSARERALALEILQKKLG
jgi:hypothetical protein